MDALALSYGAFLIVWTENDENDCLFVFIFIFGFSDVFFCFFLFTSFDLKVEDFETNCRSVG